MCLFIISVLDVTMFCCICICNGNKLFRNVQITICIVSFAIMKHYCNNVVLTVHKLRYLACCNIPSIQLSCTNFNHSSHLIQQLTVYLMDWIKLFC